MTQTVETPQTPSEDEYNIVATFSDEPLEQLSHIQEQLRDILGDAIWLAPRRALHSTLMEIICDREYQGLSRQQPFIKWYEQYNQIVAETLAELPSFEVTFNQLEVSSRAIIVRSANSVIFNDIRSRLLSKISLPEGTKLPPDITHCSLARYNHVLDLNDIVKRTKMVQVNFTDCIVDFKLLKDLGPPSFEPKTIQTYQLQR